MLAGGAATDDDHIVFIHCGLSSPACYAARQSGPVCVVRPGSLFTLTADALFCKHNAAAHLCATFMRAIRVLIADRISPAKSHFRNACERRPA
jgi:hypothetical protein